MRRLVGALFLTIALAGMASADPIICDLIYNKTCVIGGATFADASIAPAGTGLFEPFLRVQANGSEQGYNTDATKPPFDAKQGPWTHSLQMSDLVPVTIDGVHYFEFRLDINETKTTDGRYLSIDAIKIWLADTGDIKTTNLDSFGTPIYDMGAGNWIATDYAFNAGSGKGDLIAWIPQSLFGTDQGKYVYFYSEFGAAGLQDLGGTKNFQSDDGYDDWGLFVGNAQVPEPATLLLIGGGLLLIAKLGRRLAR